MNGLELIYDFFEDHVRAASAVRERRPIALGVLCFLIGGLSVFAAQALSYRLLLSVSWSSCALLLLWKLAAGFLLVAVLHLLLEMGGRQGSAAGLFVLFGFSELAWALALPLVMLARLFSPLWPLTAIFLGVTFWSFLLKARSLQDSYQISAGRAWMTLALPYLGMAALGLALASLALLSLALHLFKIWH
ncbi:MAG: hypothetical protein HY549_10810 [Elusimicrobia bacterium]|nr:hypothetical protein [Elusimicrobiota bacterium]